MFFFAFTFSFSQNMSTFSREAEPLCQKYLGQRSFHATVIVWTHRQTDSRSSSSISDSPSDLFLYSSLLPILIRHSTTHSLFHSRLKTYFFHKSYTPPRCFTSSSRTAFIDFARAPFLLSYSVFVCSFPYYFFVSVPCARLSWPYRQLMSVRKYIVSYRIVTTRPQSGR